MTAHELTELALRIERLRDEVEALRKEPIVGSSTGSFLRDASDELWRAGQSLYPAIGRATYEEARS